MWSFSAEGCWLLIGSDHQKVNTFRWASKLQWNMLYVPLTTVSHVSLTTPVDSVNIFSAVWLSEYVWHFDEPGSTLTSNRKQNISTAAARFFPDPVKHTSVKHSWWMASVCLSVPFRPIKKCTSDHIGYRLRRAMAGMAGYATMA